MRALPRRRRVRNNRHNATPSSVLTCGNDIRRFERGELASIRDPRDPHPTALADLYENTVTVKAQVAPHLTQIETTVREPTHRPRRNIKSIQRSGSTDEVTT